MNSGTRLSAIKRYALTYIQKYLQQNDAGRGLAFSVMFVRRAANTLRYGLTLIRTTAKAARFATLTSAKAAAWAAAKAASTKLGTAAVAGAKNIGNAALSKIAKGTPVPVKKAAKKTVRGARKGKGFIRRSFDRFNNFRKDPFHINSHLLDIKGKLGKIGSFWFIFDSYHCPHLFIHRITQNLRISFLTSRITHGFETESDLYGRVLKPL